MRPPAQSLKCQVGPVMWAPSHPLLTSWVAISGTQGWLGNCLALSPHPSSNLLEEVGVGHPGCGLGAGWAEGPSGERDRWGCGHQSSLGNMVSRLYHGSLSTSRDSQTPWAKGPLESPPSHMHALGGVLAPLWAETLPLYKVIVIYLCFTSTDIS